MSRMHRRRATRGHRRNGGGFGRRRDRKGAAQPRWRVMEDSEAVFRQAILEGVLSVDRNDRRFAGHFMYLFHDEKGVAWFKHRNTRKCVTMRPGRRTGQVRI